MCCFISINRNASVHILTEFLGKHINSRINLTEVIPIHYFHITEVANFNDQSFPIVCLGLRIWEITVNAISQTIQYIFVLKFHMSIYEHFSSFYSIYTVFTLYTNLSLLRTLVPAPESLNPA